MLVWLELIGINISIMMYSIKRERCKAKLTSLIRNNINNEVYLYGIKKRYYIKKISYLDNKVIIVYYSYIIGKMNLLQIKISNTEEITIDTFFSLFYNKLTENFIANNLNNNSGNGFEIANLLIALNDIDFIIGSLERKKYKNDW